MIDVYKLSADGNVATLVGQVRNDRDIGDKLSMKACLYPLHVIGKGLSSGGRGEAIYCVYENELGVIPFKEDRFGFKKPLMEQIEAAEKVLGSRAADCVRTRTEQDLNL